MTLLDRILERGVAMPRDPIMAARIERHLRRIQPDPMFRRRLRGQVVNRYVAAREGMIPIEPVSAHRREMGVLGRGVLYASLLTAMSVTAVGAASQDSLPGDALYGVKLQLEGLRMQVAPPRLRDDLATVALAERLEEVEKLAEQGRWTEVDAAVAAAVQAAAQLERVTGGHGAAAADRLISAALHEHTARLAELLLIAPESARRGLERALEVARAEGPPGPAAPNIPPPGHGAGGQPATGEHPQQGGAGGGLLPDKPDKPAETQPTQPEPTPQPDSGEEPPVGDDDDQGSGGAGNDAQHAPHSSKGASSAVH